MPTAIISALTVLFRFSSTTATIFLLKDERCDDKSWSHLCASTYLLPRLSTCRLLTNVVTSVRVLDCCNSYLNFSYLFHQCYSLHLVLNICDLAIQLHVQLAAVLLNMCCARSISPCAWLHP
jgi:hypothetical protein